MIQPSSAWHICVNPQIGLGDLQKWKIYCSKQAVTFAESNLKRMKYLYPLFYFLFLISLSAHGQNQQTVRGNVLEKDTRQPVENALVKILNTTFTTRSDINGSFRIAGVPAGRYDIEITHLTYKAVVLNNIIISSAKECILLVEMDDAPGQLQEYKIKAKPKQGQPNNEMSLISTRLFTVDETDRFAGSRGDPARMASNFAGVQGADDSRNDIVIRGNSPGGVLWRIEGVDIPNPNHFAIPGTTGGSVSIINNKILSNSDFYTGAFPAEYGNSISGAFDLKLRNGNNEKTEFSSQLGFLGWDFMAEGPLSKKSKASFLVTYRYSTLALFSALKIPIGTDAVPQYQDASFKINIPGNKSSFTFYGLGGTSKINILISDQKVKTKNIYGDNDRDQFFTSRMAVLGTTWQYKIDKKTYIRTSGSWNGSEVVAKHRLVFRHTVPSGADTLYALDSLVPNMNYTFRQSSANAHIFMQHKRNSRFTWKAGIMAQQYFLSYRDSALNFDSNASNYWQWSTRWNSKDHPVLLQAYGQFKYNINSRWLFNAGWHMQYYSRGHSISLIEPRAAIRYQVSEGKSLSFGTGIHSQIQSQYTYYYILPGNTAPHNLNMGMTKSSHFVLSYDQLIAKDKRIKIETYYQNLWNIPVYRRASSFSLANTGSGFSRFFPDTLNNNGSGYNYGVEFTLEKFFTKGYYYLATLSLFDSKYQGSDGVTRNTDFNTNYAANALFAKEWRLNKNSTLNIGGKITLAGARRYSPMDTATSIKMREYVEVDGLKNTLRFGSSYRRLDLRIAYKINAKKITHEFALDLVNITGRQNILKYSFVLEQPYNKLEYQLGFLPLFYYKIDF